MPVEARQAVDIGIPNLTSSLVRKKSMSEEIAAVAVMQLGLSQAVISDSLSYKAPRVGLEPTT